MGRLSWLLSWAQGDHSDLKRGRQEGQSRRKTDFWGCYILGFEDGGRGYKSKNAGGFGRWKQHGNNDPLVFRGIPALLSPWCSPNEISDLPDYKIISLCCFKSIKLYTKGSNKTIDPILQVQKIWKYTSQKKTSIWPVRTWKLLSIIGPASFSGFFSPRKTT